METLPPRQVEAEVVLHPCPHCGKPTDPRAVRCSSCHKRLVPLTVTQRIGGWLTLVIVVAAALAVGGIAVASCATMLVVGLVILPLMAGAFALIRRRR